MESELLSWGTRTALASTAALLLVLAVRPLCRRLLGARAALWPWLLVPLMMAAVSLPPRTETVRIAAASAMIEQPEVRAGDAPPPALAPPRAADSAAASIALQSVWRRGDAASWLLASWLAGALIFALRLRREQQRFLQELGTLRVRADGSYLAATSAIGPAVVGLLRPRIVLPADFDERYDARQRDLILAHERCHLARGDLALNLLVCALRCLYWFNPLIHLAARYLRFDQELACDAAVLRHYPNSRRAYADAILNTQLADLGLPVGCYWQSSHPLKWRIIMLTQPKAGPARLIFGAALVVIGSTLAAVSAWAALPARVLTELVEAPAGATAMPAAAGVTTPAAVTGVAARAAAAPLVPVTPVAAATPVIAGTPVAEPKPVVPPQPAVRAQPAAFATPTSKPQPATPSAAPSAHTPAPRPAVAALGPARAARLSMPALPGADPGAASAGSDAIGEIELPRMTRLAKPRFPRVASRSLSDRGGDVIVRVDLDEQGKVSAVGIEHSELGRAFEKAAIASVKRSEFAPARKNGTPVSCTALVTIRFQQDAPTDFSQLMDFPVTLRGHPRQHYSEPRYVNWRPRG